MKTNDIDSTRGCYWLIGNSIDGVCCHPHQQRMTEPELIAYLETQFPIDFNASRGEFDFTIYRDRQGFRVRRLYGYYLQGPKRDMIAQADYMTVDKITKRVRRGRTFRYYGRSNARQSRCVLHISLP